MIRVLFIVTMFLTQEDDGIPVHLKGGIADALLYRATMVLTVGGKTFEMFGLQKSNSIQITNNFIAFKLPVFF